MIGGIILAGGNRSNGRESFFPYLFIHHKSSTYAGIVTTLIAAKIAFA
jgi:hypothetical protein